MSSNTRQGSCLCGTVKLTTATPDNSHVSACHCTMCRKWGGPFLAVECGTGVEFDGCDSIGIYNSSDWAERGFCRECGTHLFYRLKDGDFYALPVGLFEKANWVLTDEVFIDEKPEFYSFAQETEKLTGAELFAKFSE